MAANFYLVKGDTLPAFTATLTDPSNSPLNLTDCNVFFYMARIIPVNQNEVSEDEIVTIAINYKPVVILDAVGGVVRYDWDLVDVSNSGLFNARFKIVYPSARAIHLPNKPNRLIIQISEA